MIGVAENDFGLYVFLKISMVYALYRSDCAYRHKYRSLDLSVISGNHTTTGRGLRVVMCLYKFHIKQGQKTQIKVLTDKDSKS